MDADCLFDEITDDAPDVFESAVDPTESVEAAFDALGLANSLRFARGAGRLAEDACFHSWEF